MKTLHYKHQQGLALYQQIQASQQRAQVEFTTSKSVSAEDIPNIIPGLLESAFKAYPIRFINTQQNPHAVALVSMDRMNKF
jgi:hypothetical protein